MSGGNMMDKEKVEGYLYELRDQLFVDQTLKEKLRNTYVMKRKKKIWRHTWLSGLSAAVLLLAVFFGDFHTSQVKASSLNVSNAISFFDIGSGEITSFTHHNGSLYVSIKNKGIYQYNHKGLILVSEVVPDSFQFSPSGESLLISKGSDILILNINTLEQQEILKGNSKYSYSSPTWKNEQQIFATKQTGSELTIIEHDLRTKEDKVITAGSQPTFIEKEDKLVFEHNGNIMIRNVRNGKEQLVDKGNYPSVSKDGLYISYVKDIDHFEDVWITELDVKTKKKVTSNPVGRLSSNRGVYQYMTPVWNIEEHEIYVLKKEAELPPKIMKIKLSEKEISAKETVGQYLQALINRDDDYAKSMMEQPPEFLTFSNPHQIGYQILGSVAKENTVSVKAEVYWTYTANPYYQVSTYEFELVKKNNRFIINSVNELLNRQIVGTDSNEVQVIQGNELQTLFSFEEIPKEYISHENTRISAVVENPIDKAIIFSLQEYETIGRHSEVTILRYDWDTETFSLLSRIKATKGKDVVMEQMSIDSTGQYLAADVFMKTDYPTLILFDLKKGTEINRYHRAHSHFWQGEQLLMRVTTENNTLLYQFTPKTNRLKTF
jgi:hypothetical protein